MYVVQVVFLWIVQSFAGFPKGFIFQKLFMECSKIFVKISPLMSEEMVGVCAKQSIMRIDLIEVSYLAIDFDIAIVLMFIYGFGDAVAHGWIEFPVIFVNFLEKFRDIQFYSHTVQISVKSIVDFFSIPLFIINWNKHRSNTSFKSKNDLKKEQFSYCSFFRYNIITGRKLPLHPEQRLRPGEAEGWKPVPEDEPVRRGLLLQWLLCLFRWQSTESVLRA